MQLPIIEIQNSLLTLGFVYQFKEIERALYPWLFLFFGLHFFFNFPLDKG